MNKKLKKTVLYLILLTLCAVIGVAAFTVFFDQAVIVRRETVYHIKTSDKIVALTFDDGPSSEWTPKILEELKKSGIKATFFMIGEHVRRYPEVARLVQKQGQKIGSHSCDHHGLLRYSME